MQTVNELIAELERLSPERRMRPVMISVRHDDRDRWPRVATALTIEDIPGEGVTFLGVTGYADDHPQGDALEVRAARATGGR